MRRFAAPGRGNAAPGSCFCSSLHLLRGFAAHFDVDAAHLQLIAAPTQLLCPHTVDVRPSGADTERMFEGITY